MKKMLFPALLDITWMNQIMDSKQIRSDQIWESSSQPMWIPDSYAATCFVYLHLHFCNFHGLRNRLTCFNILPPDGGQSLKTKVNLPLLVSLRRIILREIVLVNSFMCLSHRSWPVKSLLKLCSVLSFMVNSLSDNCSGFIMQSHRCKRVISSRT